MHWIYVLQSEGGEHYIGSSSDPWRRVEEHNRGDTPSTRGRVWRLVYVEGYVSEHYAVHRERTLKRNGRMRTFLMRRIAESLE